MVLVSVHVWVWNQLSSSQMCDGVSAPVTQVMQKLGTVATPLTPWLCGHRAKLLHDLRDRGRHTIMLSSCWREQLLLMPLLRLHMV